MLLELSDFHPSRQLPRPVAQPPGILVLVLVIDVVAVFVLDVHELLTSLLLLHTVRVIGLGPSAVLGLEVRRRVAVLTPAEALEDVVQLRERLVASVHLQGRGDVLDHHVLVV